MPEPTPENEERIKAFSTAMKLEPFQRGMKELAPTVWLTALRKVQNPNRAGLDIVSEDKNFNSLKVSPLVYWSDADMEQYLGQHTCQMNGLFRSGQSRRKARMRPARRVGWQSGGKNLNFPHMPPISVDWFFILSASICVNLR